ncbi:Solute carrier family 13 member 5 [Nymphon striatum]|nr:Solute carrier family 13 member 5 [Nymphon striatum]
MAISYILKTICKRQFTLLILLLAPLLLLPIPIVINNQAGSCGYVVLLMMIFWLTEAVPLAVTALIPVALFPFFGILGSEDVCKIYMKEIIMMLFGGLVIAIAIEHSNLHKRIALRVLLMVGSKPRWLLAGFMTITMVLSMWLSNSATTAMMVPIVDAVLIELQTGEVSPSRSKALRKCMMIGTAYAANLGGIGTIIGTGPNLVLKAFADDNYGLKHGLTFASWMLFNIPGMLICIVIAWVWLQINYLGFKKTSESEQEASANIKNVLRTKYKELGRLTFHEIMILVLFAIIVALWFFRAPLFMPGWSDLIEGVTVKGSAPVILISFLMFVIPAQPKNFKHGEKSPTLVNWQVIHQRMPWSLLLLIGGGLAMAEGIKTSCLSHWIGNQVLVLKDLHPALILFILTFIATFMTEVASNTATASIFFPILKEVASALEINPLYLMLGVAVSCSFAFMFPVATPPNAIVFEAGKMKIKDMAKTGFVMNLLCIGVINLMMNTYGDYMFNFKGFPDWAQTIQDNGTTVDKLTLKCQAMLNL